MKYFDEKNTLTHVIGSKILSRTTYLDLKSDEYEVFEGYKYEKRDNLNRSIKGQAWLTPLMIPKDGEYRTNSVTESIKNRIVGLDSNHETCHIIGRCLGGKDIDENLFAGKRRLNTQVMNHIENAVKFIVRELGETMYYEVTLIYEGNKEICSKVEIRIIPKNEDIHPLGLAIKN